ncbi:MAG: ADOP family duplicated permease [Longimicrobiales bacterium]
MGARWSVRESVGRRAGGVEGEVADEVAFHLESRIEALVAGGMERGAAAARARAEFGDEVAARAELSAIDRRRVRRDRRRNLLEDSRQDVQLAVRTLLRRPSYAIVAVLTLALGIGAASSMFAVVDAVLLRPLPFVEPDRLALIWGVAGPDRDVRGASHPEVADWRERTRSFGEVSIYDEMTLDVSRDGAPEQLEAETVSPGYFELLGATPFMGRFFVADDDVPGIMAPVVISHALWQRRHGGAPGIVGTTLVLDGRPSIIVGVAAPGFHGLSFDTDVWATLLPFRPSAATERGNRWLAALARLAPGATREAAQAELEAVTLAMEADYPETNTERRADVISLHQYFLQDSRVLMLALLGSVALLLLIACLNVLNLQLVRGLARDQEVAVRYSLGARRSRVIRQLLTESLVLAGAGGVAGIAAAWWGTRSLVALVPPGVIPAYASVGLDARVLAVSVALIAIAALVSGILPALRSSRRGLSSALRSADRGGRESAARQAFGVQHALVAIEVGLAVAIMLGAAVMVRSLEAQLRVDPGFDADNVVTARVFLPTERYADRAARILFADRVLEGLRGQPGVLNAAVASDAPLRGNTSAAILRVPDARGDEGIRFYRHMVSPGFFETIGVEVIRGRGFTTADVFSAPGVAVVSRAFASKLWPGADPIGRRIEVGRVGRRIDVGRGESAEVIGVTADPRYRDLTTALMDPGEDPDVWFSFYQLPTGSLDILLKYAHGVLPDIEVVRLAVAAVDPDIPIFQAGRLQDALDLQTANDRFGAVLLALFGVAALALAAIGLFGVMSFVVSMRRREIAIRIALGASPRAVLGRVLRQGMLVVAAGVVGGLIIALMAGQLIRGILFNVSPADPASIGLVLTVLGAAAVIANLVPAARAARTDPQVVLRGD